MTYRVLITLTGYIDVEAASYEIAEQTLNIIPSDQTLFEQMQGKDWDFEDATDGVEEE